MENMSLNEGNEKWVTFHNASGQLSGFKEQQAEVVECRSGSVHLWAAVLPLFAFNNCTSQIARNLDPSLALRFICIIQTEGMLRRGEGMEGRKESTWSWLSIQSSSSLLTSLSCLFRVCSSLIDVWSIECTACKTALGTPPPAQLGAAKCMPASKCSKSCGHAIYHFEKQAVAQNKSVKSAKDSFPQIVLLICSSLLCTP